MAGPFRVLISSCWGCTTGGCIETIGTYPSRKAMEADEDEGYGNVTVLAMTTTDYNEGGVFVPGRGIINNPNLQDYIDSLKNTVAVFEADPMMLGLEEAWTDEVSDFSDRIPEFQEELDFMVAKLAAGSDLKTAFDEWQEIRYAKEDAYWASLP